MKTLILFSIFLINSIAFAGTPLDSVYLFDITGHDVQLSCNQTSDTNANCTLTYFVHGGYYDDNRLPEGACREYFTPKKETFKVTLDSKQESGTGSNADERISFKTKFGAIFEISHTKQNVKTKYTELNSHDDKCKIGMLNELRESVDSAYKKLHPLKH